jgi:tetratricopeptide (TPR) repeat protein
MKYLILTALASCCAFCFSAETPAAAVIQLANGDVIDKIFVTSETLDGVKYNLGSPDAQATGSKKRKDYVKIIYRDSDDVDFLKGNSDFGKKNFGKAASNYSNATKTAGPLWVKELSYVRAAEAFIQTKDFDGALAMLAQLETKYPASVHVPQALYLHGVIECERGDAAAADKAFAALSAKAEWGIEAQTLGTMGQADAKRRAKKFDEAAAILSGAFAKLKPDAHSAQFGQIGAQLAEDQAAAGKTDQALETCGRLFYAPVDHTVQNQAHYAAAKILSERGAAGDLLSAFDHAVIAVIIRGGDSSVAGKAKALAKDLAKRLETDPEFAKNKPEYFVYVNSL